MRIKRGYSLTVILVFFSIVLQACGSRGVDSQKDEVEKVQEVPIASKLLGKWRQVWTGSAPLLTLEIQENTIKVLLDCQFSDGLVLLGNKTFDYNIALKDENKIELSFFKLSNSDMHGNSCSRAIAKGTLEFVESTGDRMKVIHVEDRLVIGLFERI
jgi:hypothetical protein